MRDLTTPPAITRPRRPALRALALDAGLGALAATGQAPLGLWMVTLAALALLIARLARAPHATAAFWHGLAAGAGYFALAMSWIVEPFLVQPEIHGWMAPFALALMALGGALFWALPAALAMRIGTDPRRRAVALAAALVLSDWLRGWIFTGLPWALTGHVWSQTPVAQWAAWIGAPGLSAITLAAAAMPAVLARRAVANLPPAQRHLPGIAALVLTIAAVWATGLARQAAPLPDDHEITLRLVQPDAEQRLKWDPAWAAEFWRRLLELSARPGDRDLVIWPETAVNFLLNDAAPVLPDMARAAGAPLAFGIQRAEGSRFYNSLAVLDAGGTITGVYDKFHLVPFGEYMPWGDALAQIGISAFAAQQGNGYSAGPGPVALALPGLPSAQPLICYEAVFPQHLRRLDTRPGWLLQVTNDGWFGTVSGPWQHLEQARLRAIQSGLPLVRVANTGVSAVIDARGRIRDRLDLGEMGIIDAALPAALPPTLWMRLGDGPVVGLALLALAATRLRRRRALQA